MRTINCLKSDERDPVRPCREGWCRKNEAIKSGSAGQLQVFAAVFAGTQLFTFRKSVHDGRQLVNNICHKLKLFVQQVSAVIAVPAEAVGLVIMPVALNHQAYGSFRANGAVGHAAGYQHHVAGTECVIYRFALFNQAQGNFTFNLVKYFFAGIAVVISAGIWAANHHHNKIFIVFKHLHIAYGRLHQVTVLIYPGMQVEGFVGAHEAKVWVNTGTEITERKDKCLLPNLPAEI